MFDWLRRLFGISPGVPRVATDISPRKMYSVMRHEAFRRQRADCGPNAPSAFSTPAFGLLMEIGYPGTTLTITAFCGGASALSKSTVLLSREIRATPTPTLTAHTLITRLVNTKRVSRIVIRRWT